MDGGGDVEVLVVGCRGVFGSWRGWHGRGLAAMLIIVHHSVIRFTSLVDMMVYMYPRGSRDVLQVSECSRHSLGRLYAK